MSTRLDPDYAKQAAELWQGDTEFVVFDTETTDMLKSPTGYVMQIAARRYRVDDAGNIRLIKEMNRLINDPVINKQTLSSFERDGKPGAFETHHISITDIRRKGLPPKQVWGEFRDITRNATLVGQNIIGFDIPYVNRELKRNGFRTHLNEMRSIDTVIVARHLWSRQSYKLFELADFLGVRYDKTKLHDALTDIELTWGVWLAIWEKALKAHAYQFFRGTPNQYKRQLPGLAPTWLDSSVAA